MDAGELLQGQVLSRVSECVEVKSPRRGSQPLPFDIRPLTSSGQSMSGSFNGFTRDPRFARAKGE